MSWYVPAVPSTTTKCPALRPQQPLSIERQSSIEPEVHDEIECAAWRAKCKADRTEKFDTKRGNGNV